MPPEKETPQPPWETSSRGLTPLFCWSGTLFTAVADTHELPIQSILKLIEKISASQNLVQQRSKEMDTEHGV